MTDIATLPGAVFTAKTIDSQGFTINYWEGGGGDPVVYLHGAGGVHQRFALDFLTSSYHLYLLEMPGWGLQTNDAADFDALATQIAGIATDLGLDTFHLIGTSLGGACAMHVTTLYPDRVRSLVLEAPAKFREASVAPSSLPPEQFTKAFRSHPDRLPPMEPIDPAFMQRVWPTVERLIGDGSADPAFCARLQACNVATLILFGNDDGIINPINGRTIRRLMPNSTLQIVYEAAHDMQGDRPEAFADIVGDFLRRGMGFMINEQDGLINP